MLDAVYRARVQRAFMEPTKQKTWVVSPNNRIPFTSILDTQQKYLLGVKNAAVAAGMTIKGSCSAGTGAMDAVDRWSSSADVAPRGASSSASQAWIVITMLTGVDLLIAFQGASDDIARISFSPGGLYVAAATPNQQPTATDEVVVTSSVTLIGNTASGDRIWNAMITADGKQLRVLVARGGIYVGVRWGVEEFTPTVDAGVGLVPVWGFALSNTQALGTMTVIGSTRAVVGGVPKICSVIFGAETFNIATQWSNTRTALQGSSGYPAFPLKIGSVTTGAEGKLGEVIDMWSGRSAALEGDLYDSKNFIGVSGILGPNGGGLMAWDGTTVPVMV